MGKTETIRHEGVVESIGAGSTTVRILQASACSSCSARQLCRSSESKEKLIDVRGHRPTLAVGDKVVLEGTVHQSRRASLLAYVVPLVVMLVCLFVGTKLAGEGIGALAALLSLALYYGVLFLLRDKIEGEFEFRISQEEQ